MIEINSTVTRSTGQKSVHYLSTMTLRDNKRIGYSYAYDGTTQAKGTLYPYNLNSNSNIGLITTMHTNEHTGSSDWDVDGESYTNNEVKYKTAEAYFQNYKRIKAVSVGFIQSQFGLASATIMGTTGRIAVKRVFAPSSSTFIFFFTSTSTAGTYACAGSINATTGALTFGTPVSLSTVTTANDGGIEAIEIATAKYVVILQQTATTIRNIAMTVSGTVITAGTAVDLTITSTTLSSIFVHAFKVTTDKYIVSVYNSALSKTQSYCSTVSGTVITNGSISDNFSGANILYTRVAMESTSSGVFVGANTSQNAVAQGFTLSGTTITYGSTVTLGVSSADIMDYDKLVTFRNLLNNQYYLMIAYSTPHEFYLSLSGTTVSLVYFRSSTDILPSDTYSNASREFFHSTTEWYSYAVVGTVAYIICWKYDSTTGKVNVCRRLALEQAPANASPALSKVAVGKVGTQYIMLCTTNSDTANLYSMTAQEGAGQMYFEGAGSPFATLTNPVYGLAYAKYLVNQAIGKPTAYLSIKNTTGNTVQIKTLDWFFEVD